MKLVNYGIQNEESDMRIHVSVCNSTVYAFMTRNGLAAITEHKSKISERPAFQNGVVGATAYGYPIPIRLIKDMMTVRIPPDIFSRAGFRQDDDTSAKGKKAVGVVKEMLLRNAIPITPCIEEITDKTMQISGTDIVISAKYRIQVKCDWRAGITGNIYLQTCERNPRGMI